MQALVVAHLLPQAGTPNANQDFRHQCGCRGPSQTYWIWHGPRCVHLPQGDRSPGPGLDQVNLRESACGSPGSRTAIPGSWRLWPFFIKHVHSGSEPRVARSLGCRRLVHSHLRAG